MLEKGKLVPNWKIAGLDGQERSLWDFRQKTHLVLICDPTASKETREQWQSAVALDRKQWDWLNVTVLILTQAPAELQPGIYLVDRYGLFLNYFSLDHWSFDVLEKEFIYYEAKHC